MNPQRALTMLGGAARTRQLLAAGCTAYALRRAREEGSILRVSRGTYALPDADGDRALAVRLGVQIDCVCALAHHGLPLPAAPDRPHLGVPRNFTPSAHESSELRLHYRSRRPRAGAVASVAEALDCAGDCLDEKWHLVAVDAALHRGMISLADVLRFRRTSRARREFLLAHADARAEAPGETVARLRIAEAGLKVRPQAYVDGAGRVDMEVEDLLIIQVDGFEPHSDRSSFRRDRQKSRAVIKAGRPQLTYAASELLGKGEADIVRDVREALRQWRSRDPVRIRPSGSEILVIPRERAPLDPQGA